MRGARDRAMQVTAASDVLDDLGRLVQHVRGDVLHRRRRARPHLAGQPEQRLARRAPDWSRAASGEADPPAAERHVLAEPGRDIRPLGQELGGAQHLAGLVREITVDLVGDQGEPVRVGDLDRAADLIRAGDGPGRVVGEREHEHARAGPLLSRVGERLLERGRVGDAAGTVGGDRHAQTRLPASAACAA